MIPRRLHHCWFGGRPKPDLIQFCMRSWEVHCPEYEIIEWNEDNFAIDSFPVTAAAYEAKKFAFVSDFVRAYVLYTQGGIYLDADVQIKRSLDRFLIHSAFTGFETAKVPFTAVWGSVSGHRLSKMVLDHYSQIDPAQVIGTPNTMMIANFITKEFGVNPKCDEIQTCRDGLVIYPSNFFCINLPENYCAHHFAGSWLDQKQTPHYSDVVLASFYAERLRWLELEGLKVDYSVSDREKLKIYGTKLYQTARRILKRRLNQVLDLRSSHKIGR